MAAAKKLEARIKHLREQALELMSAEKYDRAVAIYEDLSRLDETEGEWARRAADCHWHLKNPDQRLKFSLLAARAYSEQGLMLKAIAMCKVVLSIDPNHQETQQELSRLSSCRRPARAQARPDGVKRHALGPPLARKVVDAAENVPRRNSLRPTTLEGEERNAERTRARMAAAAALRLARAQLRKEDVAQGREKRRVRQETAAQESNRPDEEPTIQSPTEEGRILAPDAKEKMA
jgi:tetratricopeptide (TPR) repeat protein